MKSVLIVGLGRFGQHLCRMMVKLKNEVMVIDVKEDNVEAMMPFVTNGQIGDCTNVEVLKSIGVNNFDICFVCIGTNFQSSLEITSLLKENGAKYVVSKATRDIQAKFLLRNGADEIIYPELEVASNIAVSESSDSIFDCIRLTADYSIYELAPMKRWLGRSLKELNFRVKYNLTVIAAMRDGVVRPNLSPDYLFKEEEHLLVLGRIEDIRRVVR